MNFILIRVLTLIITLVTVHGGTPNTVDYSSTASDALNSLPLWTLAPIGTLSGKITVKLNYITDDFLPVISIASSRIDANPFHYYLPVYSLTSIKEYFLLI